MGAKQKVLWFAVVSRIFVITLQFIFNFILPDHDAGVFVAPSDPAERISFYDKLVDVLFSGLSRWDSQYFIHISTHGYTYENTLAFSPLYPMSVRYLSYIIETIFYGLNQRSATTIAALLINFICFVKSSTTLYDLSKIVLRDDGLAYRASILYCVNPASIFFSAFYTESMFALFTFTTMLCFVENNPYVYLPIGLSAIVRSNGLINLGFPLYGFLRCFLRWLNNPRGELLLPFGSRNILTAFIWLINVVFLSIVPFALLQLYNYSLFCVGDKERYIAKHVLDYGSSKNFLMPATGAKSEWCEYQLPLAYSYVQSKYWDVGFLNYYTVRQIPNFLLAFPILYAIMTRSFSYLRVNKTEIYALGSSLEPRNKNFNVFVFVVHGMFLATFCVLFVHIQVSTRLLCSATPLLYWYAASYLGDKESGNIDTEENLKSKWKVFLINRNSYTDRDIVVLSYFVGYLLVGCLMFPNFLPWT